MLGDIGVFGFRNELSSIPSRVYNIGILEQSMISVAAGMAKSGLIPFVHTIAPFIVERALEQIKNDFGYQELNGNFISVGASYDYSALGCTHHCPSDVLVLSGIPGMEILCPGSPRELDFLIKKTYNNGKPTYTRITENSHDLSLDIEFAKAKCLKKGNKATIVCYGSMIKDVLLATKDLDVTILYYTTVLPFDAETLRDNFNEKIIVCEPFYEGTTNYLINKSLTDKKFYLANIGVPRKFLTNYGTKLEQDISLDLSPEKIKERIEKCMLLF
jgi:transketolase